jgi:hypothetical protein
MKPETNRMAGALPSPRKAPDVTPRLLQLLDILLSDVETTSASLRATLESLMLAL